MIKTLFQRVVVSFAYRLEKNILEDMLKAMPYKKLRVFKKYELNLIPSIAGLMTIFSQRQKIGKISSNTTCRRYIQLLFQVLEYDKVP